MMGSAGRILLVDDEVALQRVIAPLLRSRGFVVTPAATGSEALSLFEQQAPDLVILDLGLPDIDGTEVCRRIRAHSDTPIVVLSARGAEKEKVAALDQGADDYVSKPFGPEELVARIRAALRRAKPIDEPVRGELVRGNVTLDFDRRRVVIDGRDIRLTPKEFDLMTLLVRNAGRVLTHRTISKTLWGPQFVNQQEHLRVLMAQLRKKIEPDPARPQYLVTEPWVGYRLNVPAT